MKSLKEVTGQIASIVSLTLLSTIFSPLLGKSFSTTVRKFIHSICCKMYIIQQVQISFYRNRKPFCVNPLVIIEKLFPNNGEKIVDNKNVFGPIAVLVTNCFRLEQKSYLPLQFMSGFGKTTIFNGLIGNRPNIFCLTCVCCLYIFLVHVYAVPEMDGRPVAKCD
jgi:hypothetical protein